MTGHLPERFRRQPLQTVTAAAARVSGGRIQRSKTDAWQDEAWDTYDQVGELRFTANAVANAMSHARLYVGKLEPGQRVPEEEESGVASDLLHDLGGGRSGQSELLRSLGIQLFVPGDGWLIGVPPGLMDGQVEPDREWGANELLWMVLSVSEVTVKQGIITINQGDRKRAVPEESAILVRVWTPHPRRFWHADSPVRASLPVLRELIGLTKHVSASIDSRLAGAGLLVLPESMSLMGSIAESPDNNDDEEADPFLEALMAAMLTPIKDRDAAAAVVPLVVKVADEVAANVDQSNLIRFDTPFDERARELRDETIRRLALGLDMAPELLLGIGETARYMNAWLIEESNTRLHIEPKLATICDAITTQYLQPALQEARVPDFDKYVVWWDLSDLAIKTDRSDHASEGFDRGLLSGEAWRRESGFDETDAPTVDEAVMLVQRMVAQAPTLMQEPGFDALVEALRKHGL